jgi:hypothetical protein
VVAIERLRRQQTSSPAIARQLGLLISTMTEILRRFGLNRLNELDPPVPIVRYQRARPGELLHIDTKKLGRIQGIRHRITGRRPVRSIVISAPAGSSCMCASMTPAGWYAPKSRRTSSSD